MTARELLDRASVTAVWAALGGPPLRHGRGQAWWRGGDGHNVSLHEGRGLWHDHAGGMGGGILDLIETALGCDRRAALKWLVAHLGTSLDKRPLSSGDRCDYAERRARAESVARELTAWRTAYLDSLRERRNRFWDTERRASAWAQRHLADQSMADDPRWEVVWAHALDDQEGDRLDRLMQRLAAASATDLLVLRRTAASAEAA